MEKGSSKSLKTSYFHWLWGLVALDIVICCAIVVPDALEQLSMTRLALARTLASAMLPFVPLLLVNAVPPMGKAVLVYWRWPAPYPGGRAFSVHAPSDPRIDLVALKKNVGIFPTMAREQNARWYVLYDMVKNEVPVLEAHRTFLMYRDMATLSFLLLALFALASPWLPGGPGARVAAALCFLAQFVLTALSARFSGIRMVCSVLALHATRKIRQAS